MVIFLLVHKRWVAGSRWEGGEGLISVGVAQTDLP